MLPKNLILTNRYYLRSLLEDEGLLYSSTGEPSDKLFNRKMVSSEGGEGTSSKTKRPDVQSKPQAVEAGTQIAARSGNANLKHPEPPIQSVPSDRKCRLYSV